MSDGDSHCVIVGVSRHPLGAYLDSLTQAVLGGAVAYTVLGPRLGKRAALYGMALGTLPDLDVLIDFGGPIENMTYHRGFSHSFFVQALVTPVFAWILANTRAGGGASFLRWCVAIYACFFTHSLADLFTVYGTQVLWPLTDHPFAHSILFIIDPVFTLPLIIATVCALCVRQFKRVVKLNWAMLAFATLYLGWSSGAKLIIDDKVKRALANQGIQPTQYESTPAPLNTLLWRGVAIEADTYYEIWASVFDRVDEVQVMGYPRAIDLLQPIADNDSIERLRWFTKGQYKAWQFDDRIYLSDLRMGVEGAYVFNFEVGRVTEGMTVLGEFQQLEQRPDLDRLGVIWRRIFDPSVAVSMQPN